MILLFWFVIISLLLIAISNERSISKTFCLIVGGIGVLSFFYFPTETADLYRHYENIVLYGDMGLDWVIENRCDINPLTSLLFYLFSFFNEPRFFASFATVITYGFTFLLLFRVYKFYSLNKKAVLLLSAFLLINWNYLLVVSNCRIFMLYAILAYFFYMEFIEGRYRKTAFIIYLFSILFHYGIILIVIPRLLMYLYKPKNKKVYLWALIILFFVFYKGEVIIQSVLLESISEKVEGYKQYTSFGRLQFLNSLLCIITCCFSIILLRVNNPHNKNFKILFWLTILVLATQITNYQVVYRESNIIASLSTVLFAPIIFNKNKYSLLKFVLTTQCIITFAYYLWNVYSYIEFKFVI